MGMKISGSLNDLLGLKSGGSNPWKGNFIKYCSNPLTEKNLAGIGEVQNALNN